MGKVNPEAMKDWRDGDVVYAQDYKREREILRTAINDNFDRLIKRFVVKNASGQTKTTANLDTALNYLQFQEGANVILDMDASTATLKISVSYGSGSVPTAALADGSVTTVKVANSAITEIKIANGAVTTNKLANGAVTTGKIADNAVNTAKIANNSVTEQKIANNSITSDKIVDQSVTASKLANNSVTTRAVADRSITEAKIQQGALDNRYYTKPETNALLNQKTDVFGDHKGTWQGLRVEDIDPEGFDAARITAIERQLNEDQIRSAELSRGLQVVETDQTAPLQLKKLEGRTVVNLVPTFDSGAWSIPNNAYVDSPNKATLYIVDPSDHSTILLGSVSVKPSTTYTISMDTNARYYVRDIDNNVPLFSLESSHGQKYKTFTTASNTTRVAIHLSNHILGTGIYTFENVMLNEGSEPQEYVDGIKNLSGTYIKRYGKNLLPPLYQWEKVYNNNVIGDPLKVVEPYKLVHIRETDLAEWLTYRFPVNPGQTYTVSVFVEGSEEARLVLNAFDKDDNQILNLSRIGGDYLTVTAIIPEGAVYARVYLYGGVVEKNPVTFYNPMLNYGSEPLPFEPQNNDYIIVDTELMSNPDGSNPETLEYRDGRYWKTKKYERVVLDGSLDWEFDTAYPISKRLLVRNVAKYGSATSTNTGGSLVKYNGKILTGVSTFRDGLGDLYGFTNASGRKDMLITVSNTDSGWGDNYTPTPAEIKAYFNGWRMCKAGDRTQPYNGSGDKMWYKISVSNSSITPILPTDTYPEWKPYQMQYTLEKERYEDITNSIEGSITLQEGINVIEVGEGVVVREKNTPVFRVSHQRWYINNYNDTFTDNPLKHRLKEFVKIYRNGVEDLEWQIQNAPNLSYGRRRAFISSGSFNQNSIYEVTYIAEPWSKSSYIQTVNVEYVTNIKTALDRTIQKVTDLETRVSEIPKIYAKKHHNPLIITPTLINGWSTSASQPVIYYKDQFGYVYIEGYIYNANVTDQMAFVLIEGYRPSRPIFLGSVSADSKGHAVAQIDPSGRVYIELYGGAESTVLALRYKVNN